MKFQPHLLAGVVSSCVVHVTCKWRMSIWQDLALPLSQVVLVEVVLLVLRLFHNTTLGQPQRQRHTTGVLGGTEGDGVALGY